MKIFLVGMPGCGKSTVGKHLAGLMEISFVDMDELIEEDSGKTITRIFEEEGEESFRKKEKETLLRIGKEDRSMIISTGGGAPCYSNNMDLILSYGQAIYLKMPLSRLKENLKEESLSRPLLKGDLMGKLTKLLSARESVYQRSSFVVDSTTTPRELANKIYELIRN